MPGTLPAVPDLMRALAILLALAGCQPADAGAYSAWRPSIAHWNGDCCWGHGPGDDFEWWYFREFWIEHPEATCDDIPPEGRAWECPKEFSLSSEGQSP